MTLGDDATLGDACDANQPIVACVLPPSTVWPDGPVIVEGEIWGVTREGSHPTLWLGDCNVTGR
jgi:hypothetical protein